MRTNCSQLLTFLALYCYLSAAYDDACNIPRVIIDDESIDIDTYDNAKGPTIYVLGTNRNTALRQLVERDVLLSSRHAQDKVKLSSSNSYSHGLRTMTVRKYIREIVDWPSDEHPAANETYYMFGHNDGQTPWKEISARYVLPPCGPTCSERGTKTLGVAGQDSGVSFHLHGPTFSEVIIGRKRWFVYPLDDSEAKPDLKAYANVSMINWYRSVYPSLPPAHRGKIWNCVISPGDILYFPSMYYHATLNLDPYNVFMSLFV